MCPSKRYASPDYRHSLGSRPELDSIHIDKVGEPNVYTFGASSHENRSTEQTCCCSHSLCGHSCGGTFGVGVAVLAVFAVGAGHVSLNQIKLRGERGRGLAIAALAIGYAIATLALFTSLSFYSGAIQQFTM